MLFSELCSAWSVFNATVKGYMWLALLCEMYLVWMHFLCYVSCKKQAGMCKEQSEWHWGGGRAASTKRNKAEYCRPLLVHILLPCSSIHERLSLCNPPSFFVLTPASLPRCWCGTSYFHKHTPVCTFITEPLWCGDVREDEDAAPMSRRKNFPFIYFKGNKKSFPRVFQG